MKSSSQPLILFAALVFVAVIAQQVFRRGPVAPHTPMPMPPLWAEGWLNTTSPPTNDSLAGKWVVLDAWFLGCSACTAELPRLIALHKTIGDRDDVAFISISDDPQSMLPEIEAYVDRFDGFNWPTGYGGKATLDMMNVRLFPTLVLFNPEGKSVWQGHFVEQLEQELEQRL